jgi:Mg2+ and Co2+ transporter CorA
MTEKKYAQQQRWIELIAASKRLEVIAAFLERVERPFQQLQTQIEKHAVKFPDEQLSLDKIRRYLVVLKTQLSTKSEHIKTQVQRERDRHRSYIARQLATRNNASKR